MAKANDGEVATENVTVSNLSSTQLLQNLAAAELEKAKPPVAEPEKDDAVDQGENLNDENLPESETPESSEVPDYTEPTKITEGEVEESETDGDQKEVQADGAKIVLSKKAFEKMQKQINKLTARAKGGEEENTSLNSELRALTDALAKANKSKNPDNNNRQLLDIVHSTDDLDELDNIIEEAKEAKRWAKGHLSKDSVEHRGQEFSNERINEIFDNADEVLASIPERVTFLGKRAEFDKLAEEIIPEFKDKDSNASKWLSSEMKSKDNKPLLQMPNGKLILALALEGHLSITAKQKAAEDKPEKKKPPKKETPDAPNVAGIDDTAVPSNQRKSDKDKESELRQKLTSSGNLSGTNLTAYFDSQRG